MYTQLVVAFNIGEIYTRYTFSTNAQFNNDPMKINDILWHSYYNQMSNQTPTSIILNAEKGFQSFGFEAEDQYLLSCETVKITKIPTSISFNIFYVEQIGLQKQTVLFMSTL